MTHPPDGARFRRYLFREIVAFAGVLLAVALALAGWVVAGALERQAWARAEDAADQVQGALDGDTAAVVRLGETLEAWWRSGLLELDAPERVEALLVPLLATQTFVSSVNLCRADGTSILLLRVDGAWSLRVIRDGPLGRAERWTRRAAGRAEVTGPWTPTAYDPRTRDWYVRVADTGGPRWSPEAYRFMTTKDPGITFSLPIHDRGRLAGVVALDVMLEDLTAGAWQAQPTPGTRVTLADAEGRALVLPRLPAYGSREARFVDFLRPLGTALLPELGAIPGGLAGLTGELREVSRSGGEPFYLLARPYRGPAGLDWRLAIAIPEAEIQGGARLRVAAILALAALGFAALFWRARVIAERFGRPLDRLATAHPAEAPAGPASGDGGLREVARLADRLLEDHAALRAKLRDSQRRETVGTLASGVAHDVNNQLTIVLSELGLALEELGPSHPLAPELGHAKDAVLRGSETARALVSYARPTRAPEHVRLDLAALLREVELLLSRALGPSRLSISAEPGLPAVLGQPAHLEQVVVNLAMNARDAMPEGGALSIRARRGPAGWVVLAVEDEGHGMSEEVRARVFEPWFTTKAEGRGTGLGLPMVGLIVREHGGRVEIDSAPGEGTRVSVWLPAAGG